MITINHATLSADRPTDGLGGDEWDQNHLVAGFAAIAETGAWSDLVGIPAPIAGTTASFTTALENKLAGIAVGATANASDAQLRDRATHTGTQLAATISDLATIATSGNAADLVAGTLLAARMPALTGDLTTLAGTVATTLATVNSSPQTDQLRKITVNGKGLVTATSAVAAADLNAAYGSQAANQFLAAPNGAAGNPTFRGIVAADIPVLNQSTTGSAATLTTARSIAMSGDVVWTVSFNGSGNVTAAGTIQAGAVTLAKMANMATASFIGRTTAATGVPEILSATQATALLNNFTSALKGLVPASGGGTANFLRADGTWAAPAGAGAAAQVDVFTSSGTWTKPAGARFVYVFAIGGGGGGGSGRKGAAGTIRCGGGGGSGAAAGEAMFNAAALGATETVTVGAGGSGGAAITTNSTDGSAGGLGGASSFGSHLVAQMGSQGSGGTGTTGGAGTARFGLYQGGDGGSAAGTGGVGGNGLRALRGAGGGGAGGGLNAANAGSAGGDAFNGTMQSTGSPANFGGASTVGGAAGVSGASPTDLTSDVWRGNGGGSGGGGSAGSGVNGGTGGAGSRWGAGGGGGGAGADSLNNSGAGGAGGPGLIVVVTYF